MTTPNPQTRQQITKLRHEINALNRRLDRSRRLLLALIGIAAATLITAAATLTLQLMP